MRIWFDRARIRWRRVLAVTAVGAVVVVALLLRGSEAKHAVEPVASAKGAGPAMASAAPSPRRPLRATSAAAASPDVVEACGGFRLKLDSDGAARPHPEMDAAVRGVKAHTLAAMRASPDELARAAALYLDEVNAAARDELASMAVSTRDARVYALAVQVCGRRYADTEPGTCRMLSAQQWSRLDRDNAVPWLSVAAQASARQDVAAVADAMHHIATARTADTGWAVVPAMVLAHAPDGDAAMLGTFQLLGDVIGIQAAVAIPGYRAVTQYCGQEALRDANRRQTCVDIAEVLANKSTTMIDQAIGAAIGKRVGWSAERLAAFNAERDARYVIALLAFDQGPEALRCDSLARSLNYLREVAAHGEVEAQRLLIERSGMSVEELQRAYRARSDQLATAYAKQQAAEEAASAASR